MPDGRNDPHVWAGVISAADEKLRTLAWYDVRGKRRWRAIRAEAQRRFDATGAVRTKTGKVLTDADFESLADEAERGYDVPLGTAPERMLFGYTYRFPNGPTFIAGETIEAGSDVVLDKDTGLAKLRRA